MTFMTKFHNKYEIFLGGGGGGKIEKKETQY
jgi:hypothetical protein